ncbi:MAG: hypothetical protein FD153_186 [Rhodospirillaceae bacterium]|nr:MAG: hypothetical protein FD153_186 [Rhodospirillaceae bacterium]
MTLYNRHHRQQVDIWPGFVDALSTLLIIIIFVLVVFVLVQFLLGHTLFGQTQEIGRLSGQLKTLNELWASERKTNETLQRDRNRLQEELATTRQALEETNKHTADLSARLADAYRKAEADARALAAQVTEGDTLRAALLDQKMQALHQELERLAAALAVSDQQVAAQKTQITTLAGQLDAALARKVEELARYRSEFFGRLRATLGGHPGIRIEGDRFVFQSEVLFAVGSAILGDAGKTGLDRLAATVLELMERVPSDINWVLRVDGHTDRLRIATDRFPSNWELSTARALSVLHHLIAKGVPPERLAIAGFGAYQPLESGSDETALRRNRRIEIRFDQR